jgi:hypothetical protein
MEFCQPCNRWIDLSSDAIRIGIGRGASAQTFRDNGVTHLILRGAAKMKVLRDNPPSDPEPPKTTLPVRLERTTRRRGEVIADRQSQFTIVADGEIFTALWSDIEPNHLGQRYLVVGEQVTFTAAGRFGGNNRAVDVIPGNNSEKGNG